MLISIVVTAFRREKYFRHVLNSIQRQVYDFKADQYETLVINDGIEPGIREICDEFPGLNIRYFFSGRRNDAIQRWRGQCVPNNIAIKQAKGDLIIFNLSDIYVATQYTYRDMVREGLYDSKKIVFPEGVMDIPENFGHRLNIGQDLGEIRKSDYEAMYEPKVPYCTLIHKKELMEIGGYDEDFMGYCHEDTDMMNRLRMNGCRVVTLKDYLVIHLYHEKGFRGRGFSYEEGIALEKKNTDLLEERKNIMVRNKGREWGKL